MAQTQQGTDTADQVQKARSAGTPWSSDTWSSLLTLSLSLAVLVEVIPTELGMLYMHMRNHELLSYLAIKLGFLGVILFPLALFVYLNGRSFSSLYRHRRTKAVFAIVLLNLVMNMIVLFR